MVIKCGYIWSCWWDSCSGSVHAYRQWVFLNVEEGCSRATISSILRHRVPPKDCSNVQHTWNSTEAGVLRSEKFRGCTCLDSAVLKSPQCFAHGPISKSLAEIALHLRRGLAYDTHLLACSTILCFPRLGRILASLLKQLTRRYMCYQASLLNIEKHPQYTKKSLWSNSPPQSDEYLV